MVEAGGKASDQRLGHSLGRKRRTDKGAARVRQAEVQRHVSQVRQRGVARAGGADASSVSTPCVGCKLGVDTWCMHACCLSSLVTSIRQQTQTETSTSKRKQRQVCRSRGRHCTPSCGSSQALECRLRLLRPLLAAALALHPKPALHPQLTLPKASTCLCKQGCLQAHC